MFALRKEFFVFGSTINYARKDFLRDGYGVRWGTRWDNDVQMGVKR